MVERTHPEMIARDEARDHALGVDDRRAVGITRVLVLRPVRRQRIVLRPELAAAVLVEANQRALRPGIEGARDEQPVAPDDRLRVTVARDGDTPAEILLGPRDRN